MPKQQSSLDSFFGTGAKVKKQKTLTSFFNKENSENTNDEETINSKADEEEEVDQVLSKKKKTTRTVNSKRRAIVDDDSSDDEDHEDVPMKEEATKDGVKSSPTPPAAIHKEEPVNVQTPTSKADAADTKPKSSTVSEKKPSPTVTPPPPVETASSTAKDEDDAKQKSPSSFIQKLQAQANKLVKQAKVSTNDQLEPLSSPALYQDLVKVFEQIEAISSRLEIQGLMTTFFRRLLRDSPTDLYHCVYLASNSIAPAYECVELGIGDSILMKAVGEAYGLKASK
jgi:DNA ligase-1